MVAVANVCKVELRIPAAIERQRQRQFDAYAGSARRSCPSPRAASTVSRSTLDTPAQLLVRIGGMAKAASAMMAVFVETPKAGRLDRMIRIAERRNGPGERWPAG